MRIQINGCVLPLRTVGVCFDRYRDYDPLCPQSLYQLFQVTALERRFGGGQQLPGFIAVRRLGQPAAESGKFVGRDQDATASASARVNAPE